LKICFFDKSIICTHLPNSITRSILNHIEYKRSAENSSIQNFNNSGALEFLPVFMTNEELKGIRKDPEIEKTLPKLDEVPEHMVPNEEGEFMGLFILSLTRISLAVIMYLPALYDDLHIKKTSFLIDAKLSNLEQSILKLKDIAPLYQLVHDVSLRQNRLQPSSDPTLNLNYNFLTYNSITEMAKGSLSIDDPSFTSGSSIAHNIFLRHPNISKIFLRDYRGTIYCSKTFNKETYFQTSDRVNEKFEKEAKKVLEVDWNYYVI